MAAHTQSVTKGDERQLDFACSSCSEGLDGMCVTQSGQTVHGKCLQCSQCGKKLKPLEIGADNTSIKCTACSPIGGPDAQSSQPEVAVGQSKPKEEGNPDLVDLCPACVHGIGSGARFGLGRNWHPKCWSCKRCGKAITTKQFYVLEQKNYCSNCYFTVKAEM